MWPNGFAVGASLVAATACGLFESKPFFSHSAATYGCGPAGAPTMLNILLAEKPIQSVPPPAPYISIVLTPSPDTLAGRIFVITGNGQMAARYYPWPGVIQAASSGSIAITSVDSTKAIAGVVDLQFPSWTVTARFRAAQIPTGVYCN